MMFISRLLEFFFLHAISDFAQGYLLPIVLWD